jgi:hypothetical protein
MNTLGYNTALKGWQMENGMILNMSPETDIADVLAEVERIINIPVVAAIQELPSPTEKLHSAIAEYIGVTGESAETMVNVAMEWLPLERKAVYLSERVDAVAAEIDAKAEPIDTGDMIEKPIDVRKVG